MGHIYNMKNQFWAGLGSRAVLVKKKFGADNEQLLRPVFYVFMGKKEILSFFEKLKSCIKFWEVFFTWEKPIFFRAKLFNVST